MKRTVRSARKLAGEMRVPGEREAAAEALVLAALAEGQSAVAYAPPVVAYSPPVVVTRQVVQAAPVVVGIMLIAAARARRRSLCTMSCILWSLV